MNELLDLFSSQKLFMTRAFSFAIIFMAFVSGDIFACSCDIFPLISKTENQRIKDDLKRLPAIFTGEVIEIIKSTEVEQPANEHSVLQNYVEVKLKIEKYWKGVREKTIVVKTSSGCCACGYNFQVGEKYLVYAYRVEGKKVRLGTNLCSRTRPLTKAENDLKVLGQGKNP